MSTTAMKASFEALKRDLLAEEGPRISPMRNYRFAILPYPPEREYEARGMARALSDDLKGRGWDVLDLSLRRLFTTRLKSQDERVLQSWAAAEKRVVGRAPERALTRLKEQVTDLLEGEDGLAGDVIRVIDEFADRANPDPERTLLWISRAGSLYPFFRMSSLLKLLDGKTRQLPVVLLYPGTRGEGNSLHFMGVLPPDRDYRPRIY